MSKIKVAIGDRIIEAGPGEVITFGRGGECTICLDRGDTSISRRAGSLDHERQTWWLTNRSSAHRLSVVDDVGLRTVLLPGRRRAVESTIQVIVDGAQRSHTLRVEVPEDRSATPDPPWSGTATAYGQEVVIRPEDRLAMVALFAGYLEEPPRYDPNPRTYEAAAKRLGWPKTTLIKRIEYLRTRLDKAGVPNMMGWNALVNLAEYALSRGLIAKDDLRLLRR